MNIWRSENYIVLHRSTPLPDRCILTNEYADRTITRWVVVRQQAPSSTKMAMKAIGFIPLLGNIVKMTQLTISLSSAIAQPRLKFHLPIAQAALSQYQQKRWYILIFTCVMLAIGVSLLPYFESQVNIAVAGATIVCAALFLGPAFLYQHHELAIVDYQEQDYLWLRITQNNAAFLNSLPEWDDRYLDLPSTTNITIAERQFDPLTRGQAQLRTIPVRLMALVLSIVSLGVIEQIISVSFQNLNRGLPPVFLAEATVFIAAIALQWGLVLLLGGKLAVRWLFKPRNQFTLLGGLVGLISFFISFFVAFGFHMELSAKMASSS